MKVLLIQPPFTIFKTESKKCHPPLGLAYLAAALRNKCEIKILDALAEGYQKEAVIDNVRIRYGLSFEDIKRRVANYYPDVVGVSNLFSSQYENAEKICHAVKEVDDKIITILGGAHPSVMAKEILQNKNIDLVVIGEGETALERLVESVKGEKDFNDIDGVAFRKRGVVTINKKERYQENLDDLPFPFWDIFPLDTYFKINNPHGNRARRVPFLPVITSRGCPFECIFCSIHNLWGRGYRARSAENVLMELNRLVSRFGIKEVMFEDDNLTLNTGRAKRIFQGMIDKGLDINWSTPNGIAVQTLDDELLELMKNSGCYSISIGIESGDEYILKKVIRKPITLSRIKPIVQKARMMGLETSAFFVVGLPGENRIHLKNTFRFAEDLEVDTANFFFATPLPGTNLLQICKEKKLINGEPNYKNLNSGFPNFATETFSISDLDFIVNCERIKLRFLYLMRNPKKFLCKFLQRLLYA